MGQHTVVFRATPTVQKWKHRNGGYQERTYDDGRIVKVMVPPDILVNGDEREVDDFDAQWLVVNQPANFSLVDESPWWGKAAEPVPDEPDGEPVSEPINA